MNTIQQRNDSAKQFPKAFQKIIIKVADNIKVYTKRSSSFNKD